MGHVLCAGGTVQDAYFTHALHRADAYRAHHTARAVQIAHAAREFVTREFWRARHVVLSLQCSPTAQSMIEDH